MENLKNFANATNSDLFDPDWEGGTWMVDAVETAETIEQFVESSNKWESCTRDQFGEIAGFKFVAWEQVQTAKGQQRAALSVVDLGDIRIALRGTDLTDYN